MNLKLLKECQCIKIIPFVGKGEERKNLKKLGINESHKNWRYGHITNEARFVLLAVVIINTSIQVSVQCTELHILPGSVYCMFITAITLKPLSPGLRLECKARRQWSSKGRFTHSMPFPRRAHVVPLSCRAAKGLECVFPIWFTQCGRVCSHLPCRAHAIPDHAVLLKATAQHDGRERACRLTACVRFLPAITQSSMKL